MKYHSIAQHELASTGSNAMDNTDGPHTESATHRVCVSAPFEIPAIACPDVWNWPRLPIDRAGARQDDKPSTDAAIAALITRAHALGGGVVAVPAGRWRTGPIHLRSNVCLDLAEGAVLEFSENPADYLPPVETSWEGIECLNYSPLIYALDCRNVAITGKGTLRARMQTWETWFDRPPAHMQALARLYNMMSTGVPVTERMMVGRHANLRPHFIQFNRCENALVQGVHIQDSPFWIIHAYRCSHVVIRGVRVRAHGHNSDGVDLEMTQNALVEDCVFDQGDDAIVIKSGRNHDGWRRNTPSKNIVVRNCTVRHGHHLLVIGSELSGGIESVLVEDCRVDPAIQSVGSLIYIKTNHRRGGYARDITMRRIRAGTLQDSILGIDTDVLYQWKDIVPTYEKRLTPISDITISDIKADDVKHIARIAGQAELPIKYIAMTNIDVSRVREQRYDVQHVNGFSDR